MRRMELQHSNVGKITGKCLTALCKQFYDFQNAEMLR